MVRANWHRNQHYQNLSISCVHCNCGMQDAMKQTLSIKVGQQTLNNVQTAQLWAAHPSLVVWSAIMEPLKDLGQSTSVMMALFWWWIMRTQESVRVMACGMEAYPSAFQVHTVANSEWVYASIFICMVRVIESISYACTQLICSTTCMLLASVVNLLANQLKFASAWIHSTMHHTWIYMQHCMRQVWNTATTH